MKLRHLVLVPGLLFTGPALLTAADPAAPASAAGHWEGTIDLPNQGLGFAIDLAGTAGAAWEGTIDIPTQGLREAKLDGVKIDGAAVEFALPGIPGEPRFSGKLSADAKTIAGDFSQGGGSFPFRLERKPKTAAPPRAEIPARGVPGKGVAGQWRGAIRPLPGIELALALEAAAEADGKLTGVLVSLDQGNARIPITVLTETAGKVHFETPSVNGGYTGQLAADGAEIAGEWTQNGQSTALVLKRLPAATAP